MYIRSWSRLQQGVVICSVIYALVFILVLVFHPAGPLFNAAFFHFYSHLPTAGELRNYGQVYKTLQNVYQAIPPYFSGICGLIFVRYGQHTSPYRRVGWLLIALSCLAFATGQTAWTVSESIFHDTPSPGPADIGYVGMYPYMIAGVILLFGTMPIVGRARLLLDNALAASSVGVLSWYFLVQRLWQASDVALLGKLVSVAYPLGDVVALFSALVLLTGAADSKSLRRSAAFLASGIIMLAFADSLYTYYNLKNIYQTGSWFDWGWSFGWLFIGYAFLLPLWWPRDEPQRAMGVPPTPALTLPASLSLNSPAIARLPTLQILGRVLFPYIAAITAFSIVARHDYTHDNPGTISNPVLLLGCWLIFLVILRQLLALFQNEQLTATLRGFNEQLEQIVKRRTEQLTRLHVLTKAINSTLVEDEVIAAAIEHTRQAFQADAVGLRLTEPVATDVEQTAAPTYKVIGLADYAPLVAYILTLPLTTVVQVLELPPEVAPGPSKAYYIRAPLVFQQKQIGSIGVLRWDVEFGNTEPEMLESIGLEVGTAYENARRYRLALEAADRDAVTGLYNHRAIHQRLDAEFQRAARRKEPLSLMMMDLNNFKLFNDTYGHPVGDQVLKTVARVLEAECRMSDIIGRYGGDEFLVILPDTEEPLALGVAQRLSERMSQEGFRHAQNENTIPVTLSCGIATYPHASDNRHELLTIADANLYTAKLSQEGIVGTTTTQRAHRELHTEESFGVLEAMITAVDNKDRYTRRHSEDVTEYALWIGEELGLSEETMRVIRVGGLLHDVGKIGVPDDILRKPGKLTDEEYEILKRHPQLGALIVGGVPGMAFIVDAVRSHHERWDGRGYPDALAGEAIPLLGRLMAVPDAFSAMTTSRPYRKGLEWEAAIAEIRRHTGTQFDPQMARAFLSAAEKRRAKDQAALRSEVAIADNLTAAATPTCTARNE